MQITTTVPSVKKKTTMETGVQTSIYALKDKRKMVMEIGVQTSITVLKVKQRTLTAIGVQDLIYASLKDRLGRMQMAIGAHTILKFAQAMSSSSLMVLDAATTIGVQKIMRLDVPKKTFVKISSLVM